MLRKARKHEEIQFKNDPADVETKFFLSSADPHETLQQIKALSSRNALQVIAKTDPDEIAKVLKTAQQTRSMLARNGSNLDVSLDLMVQGFQPKVDGNDASGYRVIMQVPGGTKITGFVVKEKGEYKILDTAQNPNALGLEILDRVAANNLDGSRVLLDWLRDEQHLEGGDDPFAGKAFPRFWTKGQEAERGPDEIGCRRDSGGNQTDRGAGCGNPGGGPRRGKSDTERTNIDLALLSGYAVQENMEKMLSICQELAKSHPEVQRIFMSEEFALAALGKYSEADAIAAERLKRIPRGSGRTARAVHHRHVPRRLCRRPQPGGENCGIGECHRQ